MNIKAIIGLGNPGPQFEKTRHNIGFRVVEMLAERHNGIWKEQGNKEVAEISINDTSILLVKPLTFMNNSGEVIAALKKKGIEVDNFLVVHDELELPVGAIKLKIGGSAKGHNGLKSIISYLGDMFHRLRIGIDRPVNREDVPKYVLQKFTESADQIEQILDQAVEIIEGILG